MTTSQPPSRSPHCGPWWRDAVVYQVYPRSFADADGDGVGDLGGVRAHLDHLAALGVDAVWMSPWYPSPMADAGYDVSDFRDVDPVFGTLADAEALIAEAHAAGIRMIVDLVPNHVSSAHPWFVAALADPRAPEREYFWFRPGGGPDGGRMPTGWRGEFGGPAWTRTTDPDGSPGDWYLHLFAPEQPDLNWDHPDVRAEFESILRFWFDRGVDGIRVDSAALLVKDPALPEVRDGEPHPFHDRDEVHEIYRAWRRLADSYGAAGGGAAGGGAAGGGAAGGGAAGGGGDRALIGEVWLPDAGRFAAYLRPDELHAAFNFDFLGCAWDARLLRECIDRTLHTHAAVGAPATWVLSNHDVTRHVTRYGRTETTFSFESNLDGSPVDLALGTRRARAAALLTLSLPGLVHLYQGEELGLWEHEGIPPERFQDPMWTRRGHSRDGCRVPLPWYGEAPPFGFSPPDAAREPWLPQPAEWRGHTVADQAGDPDSMLELYRAAIALRRREPALHGPDLIWLPAGEPGTARQPGGGVATRVLAYRRGDDFACVLNLSQAPVPLPCHRALLLASGPLDGGLLPPDTAAWLRL